MNILICEDNKTNQLLFKLILKNYNLFISSNGKEGLEIYKQEKDKIDLIITDIDMPVTNGFEFIKAIRRINKTIPIIVCSTEDFNILSDKLSKYNVTIIPKNITKNFLLPIIQEIFKIEKMIKVFN